jgi:pilus assembly protein Flp/PilA
MTMIQRLLRDEDGATAIEYGLIAALISLACVIAFQMLGLDLVDVFTTITDAMAGRP